MPVSQELTPAGTSARRRQTVKVDFRREMRPIAFVDPATFHSTNLVKLPTRLRGSDRLCRSACATQEGLVGSTALFQLRLLRSRSLVDANVRIGVFPEWKEALNVSPAANLLSSLVRACLSGRHRVPCIKNSPASPHSIPTSSPYK